MLPEEIELNLTNLRAKDSELQNQAFRSLIKATQQPVDWGYAVWDELLALLKKGDNRQRAIAAQVLCALAKSDPEQRMLTALGALIEVTRDERFVTARHCMQSLWMIGVTGESQRQLLIEALVRRFKECTSEKNCTLIRYDILESIRRIFDATGDKTLPLTAASLIEIETDLKYRKKYSTLWRKTA